MKKVIFAVMVILMSTSAMARHPFDILYEHSEGTRKAHLNIGNSCTLLNAKVHNFQEVKISRKNKTATLHSMVTPAYPYIPAVVTEHGACQVTFTQLQGEYSHGRLYYTEYQCLQGSDVMLFYQVDTQDGVSCRVFDSKTLK